MNRKTIILNAIAVLLLVAWLVMYPYWRDDIADKIELIFGAGRTTKILTPLFIFLPFYILMIPAVIATTTAAPAAIPIRCRRPNLRRR